MARCTFLAGCAETATGVDAYDHPVCDRHAPMDMETILFTATHFDDVHPFVPRVRAGVKQ